MKILAVVGTMAMFLVGGGIVVHSVPNSHDIVHAITESVATIPTADVIAPTLFNGVVCCSWCGCFGCGHCRTKSAW
nr:DUF808 family protein [Photobacterium profundum]